MVECSTIALTHCSCYLACHPLLFCSRAELSHSRPYIWLQSPFHQLWDIETSKYLRNFDSLHFPFIKISYSLLTYSLSMARIWLWMPTWPTSSAMKPIWAAYQEHSWTTLLHSQICWLSVRLRLIIWRQICVKARLISVAMTSRSLRTTGMVLSKMWI